MTVISVSAGADAPEATPVADPEQQRLFVEQAPVAMAMLDRDMRYLGFSAKWAADYHLDPTKVMGRSHYDLFSEIPEHRREIHRRALNGEFQSSPEEQFTRPSGEVVWLSWDVRPWYRRDGTIGGIIIYAENITRQKKAELEAIGIQRKFEAAIAAMRDSVFIVDISGQFVHFNEAFAKFYRFKDKAECTASLSKMPMLIELSTSQGVPVPFEQWPIRRAMLGETSDDVEYTLRRTDTGERWIGLINSAPIRDESNRIVGAMATQRDITELKQATKKRRESEARLSAIVDTAAESIIVIDEAGIIQSANRSTETLFLYSQHELVGQNLKTLMPEPTRSAHDDYLRRYRETGVRRVIGIGRTVEGRRKDGTKFPLDLSVAEWRDGDGKRFFTGIMRDTTERARAEAELANARRFEVLGKLAASVAHDFNNLLTVIAGNLELAERWIDDDEARQLLRRALDAAEIGAGFNRRLLSLVRTRALAPERLHLNARLEATTALLARALGTGIEFETDLAPTLWDAVADPAEVDSALLNFVSNARDAMVHGGRIVVSTSNVTLSAAAAARIHPEAHAGDYVRVSVADNGPGMSEEVLRRAFEPFFTTKGASNGIGIGIGLSSVERFARQSGGFVTLASEPGEGTIASLYLPRAPASQTAPGPAVSSLDLPTGDGELVLVVEDDERVREVTLRRIESLGYAVIGARTGVEAIARLKSGEPVRVVLTDVMMPGGVSGYDLAVWIAANLPSVKVIVSSAYDEEELARAGQNGAASLLMLRKPYTRVQLAEALHGAIG